MSNELKKLNDDVWLIILKNFTLKELYNLRIICHKWNELICQILASRKRICFVNYDTSDLQIQILFSHLAKNNVPSIQHECYFINDNQHLSTLLVNHTNVKELIFFFCKFTVNFSALPLAILDRVERIRFYNCNVGCSQPLNPMPNLNYIEWLFCSDENNFLEKLMNCSQKLHSIKINGDWNINGFNGFPKSIQAIIFKQQIDSDEFYNILKNLTKNGLKLETIHFPFILYNDLELNDFNFLPSLRNIKLTLTNAPIGNYFDKLFINAEKIDLKFNTPVLAGYPYQLWITHFFQLKPEKLKSLHLKSKLVKTNQPNGDVQFMPYRIHVRYEDFIRICSPLSCLELKNFTLPNEYYLAICKFTNLQRVRFFDVDDKTLLAIIMDCKNLQHLILDCSDPLTEDKDIRTKFRLNCIEYFQDNPKRKMRIDVTTAECKTKRYQSLPWNLNYTLYNRYDLNYVI